MKILVLGSNSFLAKEIKQYFYKYNFNFVNRDKLNLQNLLEVNSFLKKEYYDLIINTCVVGGKRDHPDTYHTLAANLVMFDNLLSNKDKYGYLFNFCSGAAFDREGNINHASEKDILISNPKDYYGLSKNIIARECYKHKTFYNFRLFGCFGMHESDNRFITNSLINIKNDKDIVIFKERYIDYISAYDLCQIVEYYINNINNNLYNDINVVYKDKHCLSDIAKKIIHYTKTNKRVTILNQDIENCYTGNGDLLCNLPIQLKGLDKSLEDMINVKFRF
jgi:dTDP-4-dehydrorhamnose reductase